MRALLLPLVLVALTGCSTVFADHVQPLVRGRGTEPATEAIRVETSFGQGTASGVDLQWSRDY